MVVTNEMIVEKIKAFCEELFGYSYLMDNSSRMRFYYNEKNTLPIKFSVSGVSFYCFIHYKEITIGYNNMDICKIVKGENGEIILKKEDEKITDETFYWTLFHFVICDITDMQNDMYNDNNHLSKIFG